MRRRTKRLWWLAASIMGLVLLYISGPRYPEMIINPIMAASPYTIDNVDSLVKAKESQITNLRPGNEAKLFWMDGLREKTSYALVYLHGFSASRGEGDPIHLEIAKRYGMNAYLARLDQHGLEDPDALLHITAASLLASAKEAIQIGKTIGHKVVVLSCSTGSTLALYLAAHQPEMIDALICYSPNIDLDNPATHLLDKPWGLQLIRLIEGGKYHSWDAPESAQMFWNTTYRNEAIVALRQLLDQTMMSETFTKITQPLLVLYYYKSDEERDETVSIPAMQEMFDNVSTAESEKAMYPIPNAGFHVIGSKHYPNDLATVWQYTTEFLEEQLRFKSLE
ncbi:MAG: alpha/beta hydrolase [Saprospiraceae bacterium]|nr:alpha/beta hydrolase [Saprospiraceae bacterium]